MDASMVIQGRHITADDLELIRHLMAENADWGRTRLSEELCRRWDWRNAQGRIKDMAARAIAGSGTEYLVEDGGSSGNL